jgi:glycosyltransferase involved in cell wall biosynthesis
MNREGPDSESRTGSRQTWLLKRMARLVDAAAREGTGALARRKVAEAAGALAERRRIRHGARRSWRPDGRPVFLLVNHACGGGTQRHVNDLATRLRSEHVRPLLVHPSRAGGVVWEEFDESGDGAWCRESTTERDSLVRQLSMLRPTHAHVHHLIGLPDLLVNLLAQIGVPYDWTIHDYYTICPRVNLVGARRTYCGEPDAGSCDRCLATLGDDQGRPVTATITSWRERFSPLLGRARRVIVPSEDVRRRLARYFPELRVLLRPHPEELRSVQCLAVRWHPAEPVRVVVLGTITNIKGSERLAACARDARTRGLQLEFYVIGSTDRDRVFARMRNVHVTGRYPEDQVYDRLASARAHLAFVPSVCPETFMYSLSILMAARLFVCCFDLGAQAERVRAWGWGRILAREDSPESINDALMAAARCLARGPTSPVPAPGPAPPPPPYYAELLTSYYDFSAEELERLFFRPPRPDSPDVHKPQSARRSDLAHLY